MSADAGLVAGIHELARLTQNLADADNAYTAALQAAVAVPLVDGAWAHVRQAGEVVRQCRSALSNAGRS
jgi:hypothetical protein